MTEEDFLNFLAMKLKICKVPQLSGYIDSSDPTVQDTVKYIGGHSVLFEGHQVIPIGLVIEMGRLLFDRNVSLQTKETLLMILAHHPSREALNALNLYNVNPDENLRCFVQLALDECKMWNE